MDWVSLFNVAQSTQTTLDRLSVAGHHFFYDVQ